MAGFFPLYLAVHYFYFIKLYALLIAVVSLYNSLLLLCSLLSSENLTPPSLYDCTVLHALVGNLNSFLQSCGKISILSHYSVAY